MSSPIKKLHWILLKGIIFSAHRTTTVGPPEIVKREGFFKLSQNPDDPVTGPFLVAFLNKGPRASFKNLLI